jgi:hypothetical protein
MANHLRNFLVAAILAVAAAGAACAVEPFSSPHLLNSDVPGNDLDVELAASDTGTWIAVWCAANSLGAGSDEDIAFSRSTDFGGTWSAAALLDSSGSSDASEEWIPQIATDGSGTWIAVWNSSGRPASGIDADIYFARSTDDGVTWSTSSVLNNDGTTDNRSDYYARLATDRVGNWICVWESIEYFEGLPSEYDISVSRSADNGATWSAPALLNTNAESDAGADLQAFPATDSQGTWLVAWQSAENFGGLTGSDGDLVVARSTDNGATWTGPALLNSTGTTDSASDGLRQFLTDEAGTWIATWNAQGDLGTGAGEDGDAFFSRSTDDGLTWSSPALLNANGATDSGYDVGTNVATDRNGTWLAVWSSREDLTGGSSSDFDVFLAVSTDDGVTWDGPALMDSSMATDAREDFLPEVAADAAGNWGVVWTKGTGFRSHNVFFDTDVFVSMSRIDDGRDHHSNCFIATAAYGSPLARELDSLRRFRDQRLLTTAAGALAVDAYYRISPPMANWIAKRPAVRQSVRWLLSPWVSAPDVAAVFTGTCALFVILRTFLSLRRRRTRIEMC